MKHYVDWQEVERYIQQVQNRFAGKVNGVYGLPRGGLVLATMISHRLDIPLLMAPHKGCLIVDDICDSGESLLHYKKNSSGDTKTDYTITTMYYKDNDLKVEPDFHMFMKGDLWIVFPWENKEEE